MLEGRYGNRLAALRQENIYLTQQISVITPLVQSIGTKLSEIKTDFNDAQTPRGLEKVTFDRLTELVRSLDEQVRDIQHTLDKMELISDMGDRIDQEADEALRPHGVRRAPLVACNVEKGSAVW